MNKQNFKTIYSPRNKKLGYNYVIVPVRKKGICPTYVKTEIDAIKECKNLTKLLECKFKIYKIVDNL